MPRGLTWARSAVSRLARRPLSQSLSSRLAPTRLTFSRASKWSPYMKTFARSLSAAAAAGDRSSTRAIFAQIQRQSIFAMVSQQRNIFTNVPSLAYETRIKLPSLEPAAPAAAATARTPPTKPANPSPVPQSNSTPLPDHCVILTLPSLPPADMDTPLQRHRLLVSRLVERFSATAWDVLFHHVDSPADAIEVVIPPSSGIRTIMDLDALLCDWGFDTLAIGATMRGPRAMPATHTAPPPPPPPQSYYSQDSDSIDSDSIDSRLFSLIVDEIVDPEEAYRDGIRDFLAQLDGMPLLSPAATHPSTAKTTPIAAMMMTRSPSIQVHSC
ncbi:hypothetical protein EV174_005205 [Coemansia sp. RSA 2320]|nr:hypothetical protein EV174_005205 [Coemansia sp. RSA 2320]